MIATVIVVAVLAYAAFRLGAGHTHHRYRKATGLPGHHQLAPLRRGQLRHVLMQALVNVEGIATAVFVPIMK